MVLVTDFHQPKIYGCIIHLGNIFNEMGSDIFRIRDVVVDNYLSISLYIYIDYLRLHLAPKISDLQEEYNYSDIA